MEFKRRVQQTWADILDFGFVLIFPKYLARLLRSILGNLPVISGMV